MRGLAFVEFSSSIEDGMMDIFLLCLNCSSRNLSIELSGLPSEVRVFVPSIGPAGLITDKIVQQYCVFEKKKDCSTIDI